MKQVLILILLTTTLISYSSAQSGMDCTGMGDAEADIKVFGPTISPNPLMPPAEEGKGVMCFFVSNDANGIYLPNQLGMEIGLSAVIPDPDSVGIFTMQSSIDSTAWEWTYNADSNSFTGLQMDTIPVDYFEEVCMNVLVTEISPQSNKNNGFHVQVAIDSLACNGSDQNDEILIFTYTSQEGAMPVTIIGFEGYAREHDNLLEWKVGDNELLTTSAIERSFDGVNWHEIDQIEAASHGIEILTQSFVDDRPGSTNYYRVRFDELDGSVTYTEIVRIERDHDEIVVFPNPVSEDLFVSGLKTGTAAEYQFQLISSVGREFKLMQTTDQLIKLDSRLAAGTYILRIISDDARVVYNDLIVVTR